VPKQKKLVPEPVYQRFEYQRIVGEHEQRLRELVDNKEQQFYAGLPTLPVPFLTANQKDQIAAETGKHLSSEDWGKIETARQFYVWGRMNKLSGVEFSVLTERLSKIVAAGRALKFLLDGPQDAALTLAWGRISRVEVPPFGYDELYPALSQLVRRVDLALASIGQEKERGGPLFNAWNKLIDSLASIFDANGWKPTRSKPNARTVRLSSFVKFVIAVSNTMPVDVREHTHSKTATVAAIDKSLRAR
jgi:hypothetical protein